jgi:arginine deiminase
MIHVGSEIGTLKRLLVHSPDSGLGKVVPSKAQDWLFEDIVHLDTIRRKEYDFYTKLLLYFLDGDKIKGQLAKVDAPANKRTFYKPDKADFHNSGNVIEIQRLLSDILEQENIRQRLVASVCAIENCSYSIQQQLMTLDSAQLAKAFISGSLNDQELMFAPIPNFIFTRDIGIVVNDHILLNKPAKKARHREALLMKYIFFNHPIFADYQNKIIELSDSKHEFLLPKDSNPDDVRKVTLEGGDVMMVHPTHLLIGVSERTSWEAAHLAINELFAKNVVQKITVVKIPKKRDFMHIDTVFTQIRRNAWILLGIFSEKSINNEDDDIVEQKLFGKKQDDNKLRIIQFKKDDLGNTKNFKSIEALCRSISVDDWGCQPDAVQILFSGNNRFPFDAREQWTDSCNLLALKEGVVLGYDRNDKTIDAFKEAGFAVVEAAQLVDDLETGKADITTISDTLILMPSAELSRARGGFHCMSMPLLRENI